MLQFDLAELQRARMTLDRMEQLFTDYRRLWKNFIAPLIAGEISEVFQTEGRGEWPPLSAEYAEWKKENYPGQTILRLEDDYIQAATSTKHIGNVFVSEPFEMEWGVDDSKFEGNYPALHEGGGARMPQRPVFSLIAADGRLDENISRLADKWAQEELAEIERTG